MDSLLTSCANYETDIDGRLLRLLSVERLLADQSEPVDDSTSDLGERHALVTEARAQLADCGGELDECIAETDRLCTEAADVLSPDEFHRLRRSRDRLRDLYFTLLTRSDSMHDRLSTGVTLLERFLADEAAFRQWLQNTDNAITQLLAESGDPDRLQSCREKAAAITEEVVSKADDLRALRASTAQIADALTVYVDDVNACRSSASPPLLPLVFGASRLRERARRLDDDYDALSRRCDDIHNAHSAVDELATRFRVAADAADAQLTEVAADVTLMEAAPIVAEPTELQQRLAAVRDATARLVDRRAFVDGAHSAGALYLHAIEHTDTFPAQSAIVQQQCDGLEQNFSATKDRLGSHGNDLQSLLSQSQGVREALDDFVKWLGNVESYLAAAKPLPLKRDALESEWREQQKVLADIDSRGAALANLQASVKELLLMSPSTSSERVADQIADAAKRYDLLNVHCRAWGENIDAAQSLLAELNDGCARFDPWLRATVAALDDSATTQPHALVQLVERGRAAYDEKAPDYDALTAKAEQLLELPRATDAAPIADWLQTTRQQWALLGQLLSARAADAAARADQLAEYERQHGVVCNWLGHTEASVEALPPTPLELALIDDQQRLVSPIITEHMDFQPQVDLVNKLGNALLAVAADDGRADSPPGGPISPTSGPTSSGVSSSDNLAAAASADLAPVQRQLLDINHRYDLLRKRLADRASELAETKDSIGNYENKRERLAQWTSSRQAAVGAIALPTSKQEAMRALNTVNGVAAEMKEKRPSFDESRAVAQELTRLRPAQVAGLTELKTKQAALDAQWYALQDEGRDASQLLADARDLLAGAEQLGVWLDAKDKMMAVLGPLAADAAQAEQQLMQVHVLKDEFDLQRPQLDGLGEAAAALSTARSDDDSAAPIVGQIGRLGEKFDELRAKLDGREAKLLDAQRLAKDLALKEQQFRTWLRPTESEVDQLSSTVPLQHDLPVHLAAIERLETDAAEREKDLDDISAVSEQLSSVSDDPLIRSDLVQKIGAVKQPYGHLRKRLQSLRAAAENAAAEGQQFDERFDNLLTWIESARTTVQNESPVSANSDKLHDQLQSFTPILQDVLAHEGEVNVVRAKAAELAKNEEASAAPMRDRLDRLDAQWRPLLASATDRGAQLQSACDVDDQWQPAKGATHEQLGRLEQRLDELVSKPPADTLDECRSRRVDAAKLKSDVAERQDSFDATIKLGDQLLDKTACDKEDALEAVDAIAKRRNALNKNVAVALTDVDEQLAVWCDFDDSFKDADEALRKLDSPPGGASPVDGKSADDLRGMLDQLMGPIDAKLKRMSASADNLCRLAAPDATDGGGGSTRQIPSLHDMMSALNDRASSLVDQLHAKIAQLEGAEGRMREWRSGAEMLEKDVRQLETDLRDVGPVARQLDQLKSQDSLVGELLETADEKAAQLGSLKDELEHMCEELHKEDAQAAAQHVDRIDDQLGGVKSKGARSQDEVRLVFDELRDLREDTEQAHNGIMETLASDVLQKPIGGDLQEAKAQRDALDTFAAGVAPLGERVGALVDHCKAMKQSADPRVDTSALDSDRERLDDAWKELQSRIAHRSARLDEALSGLGSFRDALNSFQAWLEDTEEMVSNQRPPSSDHNVIRAQLQEQKLLQKFIDDKQPSVDALTAIADRVAALTSDDAEAQRLRADLDDAVTRYDVLYDGAQNRQSQLQDAKELAEQWSNGLHSLTDWLDDAERRVQQVGSVPTEQDRLRDQIEKHEDLQREIDSRRPAVDAQMELVAPLASLVGSDDADAIEKTADALAARYDRLGATALTMGSLLGDVATGVSAFFANTDDLRQWLDDAEQQLDSFEPLPVAADGLREMSGGLMDLASAISEQSERVTAVVDEGRELCKQTTGDEAVTLQENLEQLRQRYAELSRAADNKLGRLQEALPLAENFQQGHEKIGEWLDDVESDLAHLDDAPLEQQAKLIHNMEEDIQQLRPDVASVVQCGGQLAHLCGGDGAAKVENVSTPMCRRFDEVGDQVQRRSEKVLLDQRRALEVLDKMDQLTEWFADTKAALAACPPPSADAEAARQQLANQRLMHEDVGEQKARSKDVIAASNKLVKEFHASGTDAGDIPTKIQILKDLSNGVNESSSERLVALEQVVPLAESFSQALHQLTDWLTGVEEELERCPAVIPGLHAHQARQQQDHNRALLQSIQAQRPIVERFEKTGEVLAGVCGADDALHIHDAIEDVVARYNALKESVRAREAALDAALEQSSQFSDKLDLMLRHLDETAGHLRNPEPVPAHPERIRGQIEDNCHLMEQLEQKSAAFAALKQSADDIIDKARADDPAVDEIKHKIGKLDQLWREIQFGTEDRGRTLADTLGVAERFWDELKGCADALQQLRKRLDGVDAPACQPEAIQDQQEELKAIGDGIEETGPRVESCKLFGQQLLDLVGEPDKPELEHQLNALDDSWATITELFSRRHHNLIDAMERAMNFHDMLRGLLEWLSSAEQTVAAWPPVTAITLDDIPNELARIDAFRNELDERAVEKEQLSQACVELGELSSPSQAAAIRRPLQELGRRWDRLSAALSERQLALERALLEMGHFQQAYDQLMDWMLKTRGTLDEIEPSPGDLRQTEIDLAKQRVLENDVGAHEPSVRTLADAARRLEAAEPDAADATRQRADALDDAWRSLNDALADKLRRLRDCQKEAAVFSGQVDGWLQWLDDVDAVLTSSKPTGGMPETARFQLDEFLLLEKEIEEYRPKLEEQIFSADEFVSKSPENANSTLAVRLKPLRQKWEKVQEKAADRKKKLEIALREAEAFHDLITGFNDWLSAAEQRLNALEPVSRLLDPIGIQMDDHRMFQDEVQAQRDVAHDLSTKGARLQYYCEKKDAIPIKNLLVSTKHRFEKVISRTADRTKQLDLGYGETKEFGDNWKDLSEWLDEKTQWLAQQREQPASNADRIKEQLDLHKDFQRDLGAKQAPFDQTIRLGKTLKDRAPKHEQATIQEMVDSLRNQWTALCSDAIGRQRNLEEALLLSGQFKEAVASLLEWLAGARAQLGEETRVHGDLDTVTTLAEKHRAFESELQGRVENSATVRQAAEELLASSDTAAQYEIKEQMRELESQFDEVNRLADGMSERLGDALNDAEKFDKDAHALLEWLTGMELKLKQASLLPEDPAALEQHRKQLEELQTELEERRPALEQALREGGEIQAHCHPRAEQPMKHWLTILQSRWDEVDAWLQQCSGRVGDRLRALRDQDDLIDELLNWIGDMEHALHTADEQTVAEELPAVESLVDAHHQFESELRARQPDVDEATKGRVAPAPAAAAGTSPATRGSTPKKAATKKPVVRHPKAQQLSDNWRQLWLQSMERQRKLNDLLAYLQELKRLENFDFDAWSSRYVGWIDNTKSRPTDFFRRLDREGKGKVKRAEFVDGVLKSKFPTSRLELGKVADRFDRDGMFDYPAFIAALQGRKPAPDDNVSKEQQIKSEVQRQAQLCNCPSRYPIRHIGEGKYLFGDTQKMRLVRILRSTVMVRVGGGWEALDEFLLKNDPCRAKGRTNVELREKFTLADGVAQSMQSFTSRTSSSFANGSFQSAASSSSAAASSSFGTPTHSSTPGPIIKIREKTERSVPMSRGPARLASSTASSLLSPDSEVSSITSRRQSDLATGTSPPPPVPSCEQAGDRSASSHRPPSRADSEVSDVSCGSASHTRIPSLRGRKSTKKPAWR